MQSKSENPVYPVSPQLKIRTIELHTHVHPTESREKILEMLQIFFPFTPKDACFHVDPCSGTFGQPIQTVSIKVTLAANIKELLTNVQEKLSLDTKKRLNQEFEARIDEKYRFYFRLDKQQAILGHYVLGHNSDVIQIIIAIQNKNPKSMVNLEQLKAFLTEYGILC